MDYKPIENYGLIGNLNTVALVGMDGCIDFMCAPRFDSPSVFAALLGIENGGRFTISPVKEARQKQLYLPDSNILLSRFLFSEGVGELSDFMPIQYEKPLTTVVRRMKTIRGMVHYRMVCSPRFDYGRAGHQVKQLSDKEVLFISDEEKPTFLHLRSSIPIQVRNGTAAAEFTLATGKSASFILDLSHDKNLINDSSPDFVSRSFKETMNFWHSWIKRMKYTGRWREMVARSAMVLKLLTSKQFGSIVAAPTFSLPEVFGGERNWDYRFSWIRDASFTLYALIRLGYTEEAADFMKWIEDRCSELSPEGSLQIVYGIDGSHDLTERELPHLEGYRKSSPVRIGNDAYRQLQLDIYGELMDSVYLYNKYGEPISYDLWRNLVNLTNWVTENWRRPDDGIWEIRGGSQKFLYSRLMCWVAIDRAIRLAMKRSFPAPLDRWYAVRNEIYHQIMEDFYHPRMQAFVQYLEAEILDASALIMPLVKFMGPTDPRWLNTLKAIENNLVEDSLVYRYRLRHGAVDGFGDGEGTFNMCSFWFVECLSRAGDVPKARLIFEKMLSYANHVGLFSEELGPCGEHQGNYPQAFTHLALISAAYNLNLQIEQGGFGPPRSLV